TQNSRSPATLHRCARPAWARDGEFLPGLQTSRLLALPQELAQVCRGTQLPAAVCALLPVDVRALLLDQAPVRRGCALLAVRQWPGPWCAKRARHPWLL